jgi:uncharacterized membrane protein YgaE (UPF0421/DUF939 family)
MLFEAAAVSLAIVAVAAKFRLTTIRRVLGYHAYVDIFISILIAALMHGTFAGIMVGIGAGLIMSIVMTITRRLIGYEKLTFVKCNLKHVHREWKRVPGMLDRNQQQAAA